MIALLLAAAAAVASATASPVASSTPLVVPDASNSCIVCHSDTEAFDETEREPVEKFKDDVHARAGLGCQDCHGGNPALSVAQDSDKAMDPHFSNPFGGAPARIDIPKMCGKCHSDPARMRRYKPDLRVDQEREYASSVHGKKLAKGDQNVATCVDCHGAHGILPPSDSRSPVYPTRVAETCSHCHADAKKMAGYVREDGSPLPTDQFVRWSGRVHANALLDRGDLSAPTCNDCHGNHGATPPGVENVAFVCGTCHGRESDLFRASGHHAGRVAGGAGAEGCPTCHTNHGIVRPSIAMLAPLPETPCSFCHESAHGLVTDTPAVREHYAKVRDVLVEDAKTRGLTGDAMFDDLVDHAVALPFHRVGDGNELRPEFERLFGKFRIGKTHVAFHDAATGKDTKIAIVRCSNCHHEESDRGTQVAAQYLDSMRSLAVATAGSERTLLAAKRGGVEVGASLADLDTAVGAQIELEVLVHGFAAGKGTEFTKKHDEGMAGAARLLAAGQAAINELGYRRRGLALSLVFVMLVAVALGLRIRQLRV